MALRSALAFELTTEKLAEKSRFCFYDACTFIYLSYIPGANDDLMLK